MKFRKIIYGVVAFGLVVLIICGVVVWNLLEYKDIKVAFLNIGQGDSILISRGSQQILIDGGPDGTKLMEQLGKQMPFWDRNIEIVIATHPDGDHIDGLISVFKNYSVNQFWHTNANKGTSVYDTLIKYAEKEKNVTDVIAYKGLQADFGNNMHLDIIYPFEDDVNNIQDANDTSIVATLTLGDEVFYFGGDLPSKIEDILPLGDKITVLKAGHHGSKSSTGKVFLQKIKPRDVVISVGKGNHYGHPHKRVLQDIKEIGAKIFRTDEQGTIVYHCDKDCIITLEK